MLEKNLKTTQGNLLVKIPTLLNEITLEQMMELQEKPDLNDLEAIGILSGIPLEELNNVNDINDFQIFGDHILSLSREIKHLYNSDVIQDKVTFELDKQSVTVKVMHNLSVEPAGAFMAARDVIADEINEHIKQYGGDDWAAHFSPSLKSCCQVLAHYFFCKATGKKYNEYEAEEFCDAVKKLKVTEALPIAKHFFTCYPSLSKPKTSFWHRFQQYWRKRQGSNHSKSLNISIL
jgi:hypothetical protein